MMYNIYDHDTVLPELYQIDTTTYLQKDRLAAIAAMVDTMYSLDRIVIIRRSQTDEDLLVFSSHPEIITEGFRA